MITYSFLQQYWWLLISLLGALLVFLMFVQGGNTLVFSVGQSEQQRRMLVNSTGRKWEITFTTLVTFGGAFFASFPLFYSTSFGGAYWVWMLILVSFVFQAVSYEYQAKKGNVLGTRLYRCLLVFNGIAAPVLIGAAVGTFFEGACFSVDKGNLVNDLQPVVSTWTSPWHGLEAVANPWCVVLGLAVLFLARYLGSLYFINNVADDEVRARARKASIRDGILFLVFLLTFLGRVLTKDGYAVGVTGEVYMEPLKYLHNLLQMPAVTAVMLVGVVCVLYSMFRTWTRPAYTRGIWWAGTGAVLAVMALLLLAGWNSTAYYPSATCLQSSLTIANSCSSFFTLKVMSATSLLIPFVLAYIAYCWRAIDRGGVTAGDLSEGENKY